jgi:hypothetical protein
VRDLLNRFGYSLVELLELSKALLSTEAAPVSEPGDQELLEKLVTTSGYVDGAYVIISGCGCRDTVIVFGPTDKLSGRYTCWFHNLRPRKRLQHLRRLQFARTMLPRWRKEEGLDD